MPGRRRGRGTNPGTTGHRIFRGGRPWKRKYSGWTVYPRARRRSSKSGIRRASIPSLTRTPGPLPACNTSLSFFKPSFLAHTPFLSLACILTLFLSWWSVVYFPLSVATVESSLGAVSSMAVSLMLLHQKRKTDGNIYRGEPQKPKPCHIPSPFPLPMNCQLHFVFSVQHSSQPFISLLISTCISFNFHPQLFLHGQGRKGLAYIQYFT